MPFTREAAVAADCRAMAGASGRSARRTTTRRLAVAEGVPAARRKRQPAKRQKLRRHDEHRRGRLLRLRSGQAHARRAVQRRRYDSERLQERVTGIAGVHRVREPDDARPVHAQV